jgi:hypothetical protein
MEHDSQPEAYCVHVWIWGIHPMLWRRFLVRSESTLADLHVLLQIGFDWTDFHLHRFRIRKKDYAVPRLGGLGCHDAREIKLGDLHFRMNERFLYESSWPKPNNAVTSRKVAGFFSVSETGGLDGRRARLSVAIARRDHHEATLGN